MLKKLQVELTTRCNLECSYCHRRSLKTNDIAPEVFEKLSGSAKEYVVYGYGEPLLHPQFSRLVERLDGKITVSTNGMVEADLSFADRVGVSLDIDDYYRKGFQNDNVLRLFRQLGEKAVAQVVVTRRNFRALPTLFERVAELGSGMLLTNVVAPNERIYEDVAYFEGSRPNVEKATDLDDRMLVNAIIDCSKGGGEALEAYYRLLRDVYSEGYSINLLSILEEKERIRLATEAEGVVERLREVAEEYGVELIEARFFGDAKRRECPYRGAVFVRADGVVSSCMTFAYRHREFVNGHEKVVDSFVVGDLRSEDVDDAIERIQDFERMRENMENFPWCADCPYVRGCWYAGRSADCYANEPSCSECLYSSGIARCLL
ncbi:MAG: radical SAM protein [Archaeoglobaceae archaeon]